jgi:hypothetical protein
MSQRVSKKNNYESISEPRFAVITLSAPVAFSERSGEKAIRVTRLVGPFLQA